MSGPEKVCDLLKVLRTQWLSVADLAADMDMDVGTASRWLHEMAEQGLLMTRQGERAARVGKPPTVYTLAPQWGGSAT